MGLNNCAFNVALIVTNAYNIAPDQDADVAQLVVQRTCNAEVRGSSPCVGTIFLSPPSTPNFAHPQIALISRWIE